MKIVITNRWTGSPIISGEYGSIRECLQKNRGANLRDANLEGANLRNAYLRDANLEGAYLRDANLRNADLEGANLEGANLRGANLEGANLEGVNLRDANLEGVNLRDANLEGAYLRGAYLEDAYLEGVKDYVNSHDMFTEIVRRQKVELFIDTEWVAIAQIVIHRLCWASIKKRFSDLMPSIFKKLADAGFDEWLKYWEGLK